MIQHPTTFKIQVRYKRVWSRRKAWESIDRFVIVRRDPDDSGYADKDATVKHLTDSLKFFFAARK